MTTLVDEIIEKSINEVFKDKIRKGMVYGSDGHVSDAEAKLRVGLFFRLAAIFFLITAAIFSLTTSLPEELKAYSVVVFFLSVIILIISVIEGLDNAANIRALPAEFLALNKAKKCSELLVLKEKYESVSAYIERVTASRQLYAFDLEVAQRIEWNLKNKIGSVSEAEACRALHGVR